MVAQQRSKLFFMFFGMALLLWQMVVLSEAAPVPDTGQTKCYDTAGAEIACAGTGQDGAYNINPMSFTDNGNGTVTDNVTGLLWQKEDDNTKRAWADAGTYCESLTLGGQSGWRLPLLRELITIVDYGVPSPGPTINATYFPNTRASTYQSSTPDAGNASNVLVVFFDNGMTGSSDKSPGYVRCVRGGQLASSFTNNGNGTATDNVTGLMWEMGDAGTTTWANALTYCAESLRGYTDWRMPNIKELASLIVDYTFTTYLPPSPAGQYWSSTTSISSAGTKSAIVVFLRSNYGSFGEGSKPGDGSVRCVRSGQSGTQNNCAVTVSSSLAVHIPIITFSGANYWADLQYNSASSNLTIENAGAVSDASPYSSCAASTLSSDFKLHIPALLLGSSSYWLDLQLSGSAFVIAGFGVN